ncbi:MAG: WYL domain-containing protein [Bacteroidales bacterium]|jgi:predicted DNA-binding transcriptional regulator YafY|nr:WYL domain-containing protein [Bacteroidales bacterium]
MSLQTKIKRFLLILEKTRKTSFYPTAKEIIDFIEEQGLKYSARTFERDKEQLRVEFDIEIKYVESYKGYHFFEENSIKVSEFIQILTTAVTAETFLNSLSDYKTLSKYIHISSTNAKLQGIHYLRDLLEATRSHRTIEFDHFNFWTKKITHYIVNPYLLKEYQNRWYVVGTINDSDTVRTFGIDRIQELKIYAKSFKVNKSLNIKDRFDEIIGVSYDANKIETIQLEFTEFQAKYIESQPIHHTQQLQRHDDKIVATISVIPNHELMQRILMYGANVKVIEPLWLREKIKDELKKAIEAYN